MIRRVGVWWVAAAALAVTPWSGGVSAEIALVGSTPEHGAALDGPVRTGVVR